MATWGSAASNQFISTSHRPVTRLQLLAKSAEISVTRYLFPVSLPPCDIELFASLVEKEIARSIEIRALEVRHREK